MKTKRANQEYTCDGCIATIAKGSQYARVGKRIGSWKPDSLEMRNGQPVIVMHGAPVDLYLCAACAASPPQLNAEDALKARTARRVKGKHVAFDDGKTQPWWPKVKIWCGPIVDSWDEVTSEKATYAAKFDICEDCKRAILATEVAS